DYFDSQLEPIYNKREHPFVPCLRAMDRIQLCKKLGDKDFAEKLYWDYEGPVIYLLLTCWDILGNKKPWKNFRDWIMTNSEDYVEYRNDSIKEATKNRIAITVNYFGNLVGRKNITSKLLAVNDVFNLHKAYNSMFGVNKSFQFFFDSILTWKERCLLFGVTDQDAKDIDATIAKVVTTLRTGSFKIMQWEMKKKDGQKIWISDQKMLVNKLQKLRNSFTHSGNSLKGFGPNHQMSVLEAQAATDNLDKKSEQVLKILARELQSPSDILVHNSLGTVRGQRIWKVKKVEWCEQVYHSKLVPTLSHIAKVGIIRRIELVTGGQIG
ncbi:MAG: hypothetical protein OXT67_13610, partial [Zetaproteobacteria bacterium]|nr:hypothetical protein [Zetaproteobacteria bacterium]